MATTDAAAGSYDLYYKAAYQGTYTCPPIEYCAFYDAMNAS